ncbi:hypothetical protein LTR85_008526 [Meristemomyces frigidus]|nr:hypothetical protein LTR85_008526 [Meristemomyces frigidus]
MRSSSQQSSSRTSDTSKAKGSESNGSGQNQGQERRKSSLEQVMDKAKAKLSRRPSGTEALPDDAEDFERQKAKEIEKQNREKEYERLGLGDKTKYGMSGAGGWKAG